MPPGAIVFDLDGTLIDSAPDIQEVANFVLNKSGAGRITLAQTRDFIGNGVAAFISRMIRAEGLDDDPDTHARLMVDFMTRYNGATAHSQLYPGVIEALEVLANAKYRMGLCTNKPHAATLTVLDAFGLARFFDVVVGGDSLPISKPDPTPLLHAYNGLKTSPDKRLYVGDSEVDAQTAQRAAVPFALFSGGYRKSPVAELVHTYAFDAFSELPDICASHF